MSREVQPLNVPRPEVGVAGRHALAVEGVAQVQFEQLGRREHRPTLRVDERVAEARRGQRLRLFARQGVRRSLL